MGRHSAPIEDDEEDIVAVVVEPTVAAGRHARPAVNEPEAESDAQLDDEPTHQIPLIEAALVAEADQAATHPTDPLPPVPEAPAAAAVAPADAPVKKKRVGKGNHSTSADLALLREHSEVRARCIAAVVVPFVLYTALLLAIGSMDVYLIWIWIPTVSAGILAGGFLDAAHRRYDTPADPPLPDRQTG